MIFADFNTLSLLLVSNETAALALDMLTIFGAAKLLAEVFEQIKVPGIVGEILAGIIVGPSVLGWISPGEVLTALADLGVMFLLFRVGLEVKSHELLKLGFNATLVALLGVVVPFLAGWGILLLWGQSQIEAIFVGAAMVATSVGITARVLADMGLLQARASKIILAAAVIDDVLGLLVLALVTSLAKGQVNFLQLGLTAAMAVGFTILVAAWGTRTMRKVIPRVQHKLRVGEAQFAFAMVMLFGLSLLAVYAGVAAIIGAFLAGMALSESVDRRVHDLAEGVSQLLVPFFLAGIGLTFDMAAFARPATLLLALVIFVAAVLSKFLGCAFGAYRLGRANALRCGSGMVPRGEVGMVVAQIGIRLGTISQAVYGVVVFMAVATTLIAPFLLRFSYKGLRGQSEEDEPYSTRK